VCSGGRLRRPCLNCGFDPHRIRCESPASDATTVGSGSVEDQRLAPGAAGLHVAAGLPFLRWAVRAGHLPGLTLPPLPVRRAGPITQHRRLELLGQLLTDQDRPLRSRVAACLVLLFAQPATRVVRLTIHDVTRAADGQVFVRFGEPATPVPEPFATCCCRPPPSATTWIPPPTPVPAGCSPDAGPAGRCTPATSANSSVASASPPWPAGPPRSASSCCRSQPPSSPRRSATTTTPPPASPPRPERPGAATPPATTAVAISLSDSQEIHDSRLRGHTSISPPATGAGFR
jgi:hypothetical protein